MLAATPLHDQEEKTGRLSRTTGLGYGLAHALIFGLSVWGYDAYALARSNAELAWAKLALGLPLLLLIGAAAGGLAGRRDRAGVWVAGQPARTPIYLTPRGSDHPTLAFAWRDGSGSRPAPDSFDGRYIFPLTAAVSAQPEQYVAIEWIGQENYLGERISKNQKRTRGANFTSADAAVLFERHDGQRQIVLIEWKYTESYSSTHLKFAKSGTDRSLIYAHLYDQDDDLLDKKLLPNFDVLLYEPFYQFMRQQYLAHEMEKAGPDHTAVAVWPR